MLHRYVVLVSTSPGAPMLAQALSRLRRKFPGWTLTLDVSGVAALVQTTPPSRLRHRPLGAAGCLIGLDFSPQVQDISRLLTESWGAYVAVQADEARRTIQVSRDPTGRVECWRISLEGVDVLFSHYEDVYWLQPTPSALNWDYIGYHLQQEFMHGEATGLADVTEVLPGQFLNYTNGVLSVEMRWWPHKIAAQPHASIDAASATLRDATERSVTAWADQYERIGLFLSGGLDSAIVLSLLDPRRRHRSVVGVNHSFPGMEGDETEYARAAARIHGISLVERTPHNLNRDLANPFPRRFMRPRTSLMSIGSDLPDVEIAHEHGFEAYFTGTGGDHVFFSELPATAICDYLSTQGQFSDFIDTSLNIARLSRRTVWQVFGIALKHRLGVKPTLTQIYKRNNAFLSEKGSETVAFHSLTHPWILEADQSDTPPTKLSQIIFFTELQRHYKRVGRAEHFDEVHPLHSQPVMEASLATPAYWYALDGVQRGLARKAFGDILPPIIRDRRSKGSSTTYVLEFLGAALPRIRELLLEGQLAKRGLLDRVAVEQSLTPLNIATSKNLMPLFLCLPTEMWIQQAESDRAAALAA